MGARQKLNQGYVQGALVIAGVIGAACGSWTVFWIAAIILVGSSLQSGEVRLTGRRGSRRNSSRNREPTNRRP